MLTRVWITNSPRLSHPVWAPSMSESQACWEQGMALWILALCLPGYSKTALQSFLVSPSLHDFQMKEDLSWWVHSAPGWWVPRASQCVVGPTPACRQPSVDVAPAQGLQCSLWKPGVVGCLQRACFIFWRKRVTTTCIVRSNGVVLTSAFLTGNSGSGCCWFCFVRPWSAPFLLTAWMAES